jgi:hypothetical protein
VRLRGSDGVWPEHLLLTVEPLADRPRIDGELLTSVRQVALPHVTKYSGSNADADVGLVFWHIESSLDQIPLEHQIAFGPLPHTQRVIL